MAHNQALRDALAEFNPAMLFMDDHDQDLIGVASRFGMAEVAAYDYDKVIATLKRGGMTEEQAVEWFEFNQLGAWMGEGTPVFVRKVTEDRDLNPFRDCNSPTYRPSNRGKLQRKHGKTSRHGRPLSKSEAAHAGLRGFPHSVRKSKGKTAGRGPSASRPRKRAASASRSVGPATSSGQASSSRNIS